MDVQIIAEIEVEVLEEFAYVAQPRGLGFKGLGFKGLGFKGLGFKGLGLQFRALLF